MITIIRKSLINGTLTALWAFMHILECADEAISNALDPLHSPPVYPGLQGGQVNSDTSAHDLALTGKTDRRQNTRWLEFDDLIVVVWRINRLSADYLARNSGWHLFQGDSFRVLGRLRKTWM